MIKEALKYYGQKEVEGENSNAVILEMINRMFPQWKDDSTLPWCSVFMNYIAEKSGVYGTGKANARSWLDWGHEVSIDEAEPGDVIIFWRGNKDSWKGHVGLFVNYRNDKLVRVLGGNQDNAINIRSYARSRILGVRRINYLNC